MHEDGSDARSQAGLVEAREVTGSCQSSADTRP